VVCGLREGRGLATRPYLDQSFQQIDVPVLYAHEVPWRQNELEHLVRILTAMKPEWAITKDFQRMLGIVKNRAIWKKYEKLMKRRGDLFILTLVFEKNDIRELVLVLTEARDGRRGTNEELLAEKQQAGKDIWET
jgi:hypothetical protein